uniref:Bromo domain-containing protein n=1 Tax=Myotis lucifugus TaxID=59463 RepID=G1QC70_MYOLU
EKDHDEHKDRTQKKRKTKSRFKGETQKRVKEDRKKPDRDHVENEAEKDLQGQAPAGLDLPPDKPPKLLRQTRSRTHTSLNQLMRQLQIKDPSAFFSFPVTDFIAPSYFMIINHPIDFSTMKKTDYQSTELKDNFKLMCTDAMIYNKPGTTYYKAATKLLHSGVNILSQERIQSLTQSTDFMAGLQKSRKQKDWTDTPQRGEEGSCWPPKGRTQARWEYKSLSSKEENKDKNVLEGKVKS